jgi:hypothetical protein
MKISETKNSQMDSFSAKANFSRRSLLKKKDRPEFDFFLEELLKGETRNCDEYSVLLPQHGRFWDNGYEDVE